MIPQQWRLPGKVAIERVTTLLPLLLLLSSTFCVSDAEEGRRFSRSTSLLERRPWPNGVIPYVVDDSISPLSKQMISEAMAQWEQYTCVRFKPAAQVSQVKVFVNITSSPDPLRCVTPVGLQSETSTVILGAQCFANLRSIIHELGHVIGLDHEHQHPDRDSQLTILSGNIQLQMMPFFDVFLKGTVNTFSLPYDPLSIMHYPSNAFATNPSLSTMVHHNRAVNAIMGWTNQTSPLSDIPAVRQLYGCRQDDPLPNYGVECKDYDINCDRVPGMCTFLRNWAEATCLVTCGICKAGEIIVPGPRDVEALKRSCSEPSFCSSTPNVCRGPYAAWARVNCPCKCIENSTTTFVAVTDVTRVNCPCKCIENSNTTFVAVSDVTRVNCPCKCIENWNTAFVAVADVTVTALATLTSLALSLSGLLSAVR